MLLCPFVFCLSCSHSRSYLSLYWAIIRTLSLNLLLMICCFSLLQLTPKEAFRLLSHKFHGKGPGKMKQEKRMRQYQEELKVKQMKNADTPSLSVSRMREAQAKLQTPYLVLSGNVKPGYIFLLHYSSTDFYYELHNITVARLH